MGPVGLHGACGGHACGAWPDPHCKLLPLITALSSRTLAAAIVLAVAPAGNALLACSPASPAAPRLSAAAQHDRSAVRGRSERVLVCAGARIEQLRPSLLRTRTIASCRSPRFISCSRDAIVIPRAICLSSLRR